MKRKDEQDRKQGEGRWRGTNIDRHLILTPSEPRRLAYIRENPICFSYKSKPETLQTDITKKIHTSVVNQFKGREGGSEGDGV